MTEGSRQPGRPAGDSQPAPTNPAAQARQMGLPVPVRRLHPAARLPERSHPGDAGYDLFSVEDVTIPAGERRDIGTGIALAIPTGFAGFVQARSGLAFRRGLMVVNAPGLIDSGYRGELRVCLYNSGTEELTLEAGDRIAQLVIQAVADADFVDAEELPGTRRGESGFGSTGGF